MTGADSHEYVNSQFIRSVDMLLRQCFPRALPRRLLPGLERAGWTRSAHHLVAEPPWHVPMDVKCGLWGWRGRLGGCGRARGRRSA